MRKAVSGMWRWGAWLALASLSVAQARELVPGPGLKPEGIPPLIAEAASEPADPTSPRVFDWHPLEPKLLVAARRGGATQVHVLERAGAPLRALTEGKEAVQSARYEPEAGRYIVFARDTGGDEAYRLYRLTEGQAVQAITPSDGRVSEWRFLPSGQGLVYLRERLDREGGERQAQSRLVWVDPEDPQRTRDLLKTEGARLTQLRLSEQGVVLVSRSQGGRSQWLRVSVADGAVVPLGSARRQDDADSNREASETGPADDGLWLRQAARSDFRHPVRLLAEHGRLQSHLTQEAADVEAMAEPQGAPGRPLALVYNVQGRSELRFWQPGQALQTPNLDLPAGVIQDVQWHPKLPLLVFHQASATSAGRLWVWDHEHRRLEAWAGGESRREPLEWRLVQWRATDGEVISGWHLRPPASFAGPRPVYVHFHGGPSSQSRPGFPSPTLRALVMQLGMHVLLPNVRGSDGQGKRFLNLDNGRRRLDAVRDVSALLDWVAVQPDMNAQQVVVGGGSYGGYMALAVAVAESDRIAGSICRVGIANFVSFLENTESYRRDNRRAEYGDERDPGMRAFLTEISPLTHAQRVRKPLFVVHGRNDPRVPYSEAQAMVAAVRAHGTPVWFLTAENEGHSFTKSENRDYLHHATLAFVRQALLQPLTESSPGK
ncbi:S9 family peptidase [Inhella gelatinilytica]|uniref:S9 family peptidase n=1 Tax=Inhella gelatinilytica TaxID=2795030 RepID=A0A931NC59_9BURK|nr:prolyl oligopeptidase family serine peptidase [Inhella gelatinilytica]MBH9551642.1 S9 family peptidase [Inhella gelatinilytica]